MLTKIGRGPRGEQNDLLDALRACHERIRTFIQLARRVGEVDETTSAEVVDVCERCERYFVEALPLHVADEEESILPRLRGRDPDVDAALATMHDQHDAHEAGLTALATACSELREAPTDPKRREALRVAATTLGTELEQHLRLEEEHIFPAIRSHLSEDERSQISAELRDRRTPSG